MEDKEDKAQALEEFKAELSKHSVNKKNMQRYIDSYMGRVDITGKLASELRCDALLVVGSKSSQCGAAEYMHTHMDKVRIFLTRKKGSSMPSYHPFPNNLNNAEQYKQCPG